ncbi:MAG: hypothetical protein ABL902_04330 [Gallionella sp.]
MFQKKTIVVIGAGASHEAKLPTGDLLKKIIADKFNFKFNYVSYAGGGDEIILNALRLIANKQLTRVNYFDSLIEAAIRIRDGMPLAISIDNFIDAHQGDVALEKCGKLAIVKSVLEAEKQSLLFNDEPYKNKHIDFNDLEETWFISFFRLLTENCKASQLQERFLSIELIIFNYDRCIEHFLYHSLHTYYGLSFQESAKLVQEIKIFHPYGTVGGLPWDSNSKHKVDFGGSVGADQLIELAEQIKTFSEGTDPISSDVSTIRKSLSECNLIMFLGFAFHRLNLELIQPEDQSINGNRNDLKIYGTAYGFSTSDCEIISTELNHIFKCDRLVKSVHLGINLKCAELFKEYWRSLSLS